MQESARVPTFKCRVPGSVSGLRSLAETREPSMAEDRTREPGDLVPGLGAFTHTQTTHGRIAESNLRPTPTTGKALTSPIADTA
jgi:hypothetical protein